MYKRSRLTEPLYKRGCATEVVQRVFFREAGSTHRITQNANRLLSRIPQLAPRLARSPQQILPLLHHESPKTLHICSPSPHSTAATFLLSPRLPSQLARMVRGDEVTDRVVPVETIMSRLKACMSCSLIKTVNQFFSDGCENCTFMSYLGDRERIQACCTSTFVGFVSLAIDVSILFLNFPVSLRLTLCNLFVRARRSSYVVMHPTRSWVAKWQRVGKQASPAPSPSFSSLKPAIVSHLLRHADTDRVQYKKT